MVLSRNVVQKLEEDVRQVRDREEAEPQLQEQVRQISKICLLFVISIKGEYI